MFIFVFVGPFYLIVEYCDNGSLIEYLRKHQTVQEYVNLETLSLEWKLSRSLEICNGMKFLAKHKVRELFHTVCIKEYHMVFRASPPACEVIQGVSLNSGFHLLIPDSSPWIPDSIPWIPDSSIWISDSSIGFQIPLLEFRMPLLGFRIPLPGFRTPIL